MKFGKAIEVVTAYQKQYKSIVTKMCRPLPIQIQNYVELDQNKMEMKL